MRQPQPKRANHFKFPRARIIFVALRQFSWIALLLLFCVLIAIVFFSNIFHINIILCTYNERPCSQELEAELKELIGTNILTFRHQRLEEKLRKADITIDTITINSRLPHRVSLTITSRNAHITIAATATSPQLVVDNNLIPFNLIASPSALPTILSPLASNVILGQPIDDESLKSAILLGRTLTEYFINFDSIQAEPYTLRLTLRNNIQVIFPIDHDFSQEVTSLQLILRESTIQPQPKEIDLRFTKPILR